MATFDVSKEFPELSDKYRRISLYSDFSNQRELNPVNYEANVAFWKRAIIKLLDSQEGCNGKVAICWYLRSDYLAEALAYQEIDSRQIPLSISIVMVICFTFFSNQKDEMVKSGDLIPAESYLSKYGDSSNQDWGGWFWRQVSGLFASAPSKLYREFVVQSKLTSTIDRILKHFNSVCVYTATDALFELPGLISKICRPSNPDINWDAISEQAIDILLAGLYERGCAIRKEGGVKYIKLTNSIVNRNAMKFTDIDLNILSVKKAYERLRTQSQKLEEQIAELHAKIKESVRVGNKSQAVRQLKQRKQLDSLLDNRLAAAENLIAILNQVQQTELDRLVVDAYQEGSKGLRELLAGIGVDQVQTAMDQIQDALADYADVQETISTPLVPDDDALEAELNSLLREETVDASDSLLSQLENMKISNDPLPADPIKSPARTAELV